jgi:adenylate cyclase
MARLIISSPDGKRGVLEITRPVVTIGRGGANDLVLEDSSVSRLHAVVKQRQDGSVVIADRGSTNGVQINGAAIDGETTIHSGDVAAIGAFEIQFESVDDVAFDVHSAQMPAALAELLAAPAAAPEELEKLQRENYLLRLLYDAGTVLHAKASQEEISEELVNLAFRIEGVERGYCMLMNERGQVISQSEVRFRRQRQLPRPAGSSAPRINLSRAIFERIRAERVPLLINDLRSDERFQASESALHAGVRSAMCAPLLAQNRLFGMVYVDNLDKSDAFTQEELNIFALLASQAALAMASIAGQQKLARHAAHRAALERFLAPELVEMIASNPNLSLGGVNQKVSVLFADIRGFTTISETLPPDQVVEILNAYFTRIADVIFDHSGTLDKFLGDGVMAVFGAPISKGNDAANAVRAAIEIQRLVAEMARDAAARSWPEIHVGIGINTGLATAGNIGSPKRLDYTVVGDTVNVAARLMAAATGGQILISDSTAKELDSTFKLGGRKPVLLKGKSKLVPVASVRWMKAKATAK